MESDLNLESNTDISLRQRHSIVHSGVKKCMLPYIKNVANDTLTVEIANQYTRS
jgi:hypothetical protein